MSESTSTETSGMSLWAHAPRERPPEMGDFGVTLWTFASMVASCRGLEPEMRARLVLCNRLRVAMVNLSVRLSLTAGRTS